MPEILYTIDAKISNFEWFLLRELRKLQSLGYGDIQMKCVDEIGRASCRERV
jgi:hypothetical protein